MATNDDVHVRLCQQQITKLDLEIKALIQDIQRCDGPLDTLEELNQNITVKIDEMKSRIEELEKSAREQDKEVQKILLLKESNNHRQQLTCVHASLRKANMMCQLAIEKREKDQLFKGSGELRRRPRSNKEALVNTTSGITENLMSLSRMMAAQVHQSENTMGTLVSSSTQIGETHEEFKSMSGHIQNSRKLLTKYSRRECTDKLLILLALVFFFASVLYIIKKRVFSSADSYV